jgi:hypothetical protein
LLCRTNFTCAKYILHTLTNLQQVSPHYMWHKQGIFVFVITTTKTPWWWNLWCAETCWRIHNVWRIRLMHIKLVLKVNWSL